MEFVYPRIREYCRERYGIEFQVPIFAQRQTSLNIGGGHALGSAGRDDQRAHDHRALHERACFLPAAFHRSSDDIMTHIEKLFYFRSQLHLPRGSEVWVPSGSSCCGFSRTEVVEGDAGGHGDRCDPARQVNQDFDGIEIGQSLLPCA